MRAGAPSAADPLTPAAPPGAAEFAALMAPPGALEFAALMAPLGPFGPRPRLAAGVSGGPHSLALALLADRWARERGGSILALVCDHGLRPGSAAEADGVVATLVARGIPARLLRLGLAPGPGLQERARAARLAALLAACAAAGTPWLLLGQHRADQAETLLIRALSGSGPSGLAGMAPVRAAAAALLLRPLLGVAPARLEAVVAAAGLDPLRDPSNADPRFARARLRAALADPAGEGAAVAVLAALAARFAAGRATLEAEVAARLATACRLHEAGFARLDLGALGGDAVALAAMGGLLRMLGGRRFAPAEAAVAGLLARGEGTLGGAQLGRDGLLRREAAGLAPPVPARPGACWDGRFRYDGPGGAGLVLGAAGPAARRLPRPAGLPGAVLPLLPALHRDGALAVVPALSYPDPGMAARHPIRFAPEAGTVT